MEIQKGMQRIGIQSDSQLVVNPVNGKIRVPKDIINLAERCKTFASSL